KAAARPRAARAVRDLDWGDAIVCVRVNAWDSPWTAFDVLEVVGAPGPRLDEVMLPKVEPAAQAGGLDLALAPAALAAGLPVGSIGIEVQVETAKGSWPWRRSAPRRPASRPSCSAPPTWPPPCSSRGSPVAPSSPTTRATTSTTCS